MTLPGGADSIHPARSPEESAIVRIGHISDLHIADRARYPRNGFSARDCDRHSARLAKGLPTGSDIKYADEITLGQAIVERKKI